MRNIMPNILRIRTEMTVFRDSREVLAIIAYSKIVPAIIPSGRMNPSINIFTYSLNLFLMGSLVLMDEKEGSEGMETAGETGRLAN